MMNKRGDIFQLPYLIVLLLAVALIGMIFIKLSWEITGAYEEFEDINNTETARGVNLRIRQILPHIQDEMVLFLFLGSVIALMVAAVRTNFSPIILFVFLILLILSILVASGAVNIYQGFAESEELSDISSKFTFTNMLFSKYFPLIIMVIGAIILIIMYGKSGSSIIT